MLNLILHITIPQGLALTNGQVLQQPVTFDVMSAAHPFYASVDQVRLSMGPLSRRMQDITVACKIYEASKEADLFNFHPPSAGDHWRNFAYSRNLWVQNKAARDTLLSLSELLGSPQSHVLANFSYTRQKGFESEGVPAKLKIFAEDLKKYEIALRSGGKIAPGGHVGPRMAAKGVMDWQEHTPSRNWITTGMGANTQTVDSGGPGGGRGKPVKFFASPMFMGPMSGYRFGVYQSSSPLSAGYPYFATFPLPTPTF